MTFDDTNTNMFPELSDRQLSNERYRIEKLYKDAGNSLAQIKTEQMRRWSDRSLCD
jgi:hypothetical protein